MDTLLAPISFTAYSIRTNNAPRSYSPTMTVSCSMLGDASTKTHLPSVSHCLISHPKPLIFLRMSEGDSSKVINTPCSPAINMPSAKNWHANTVLALPEVPLTSAVRPFGSPPSAIRSNPDRPVGNLTSNFESDNISIWFCAS